MNTYTAEQLTTLLQSEGYPIELRTVKYYAQLGILSERPKWNGRKVFVEKHLDELRAILTLKRTGKNLTEIKELLPTQTASSLKKLSSQRSYISADYLLEYETVAVHPQINVQFHQETPEKLKTKVVQAIQKATQEE
ncbi:MerR family transcriptional regulator [Risungbinella massiliensis]|uniref:MerR family transcriptional regulator n=1 Tax=Risungbinella massiliensis TaxID=1329796 RepID=UPI0005CBC40E|nr:MerR family transcriptional regulator [Risungbinella massiliensis]